MIYYALVILLFFSQIALALWVVHYQLKLIEQVGSDVNKVTSDLHHTHLQVINHEKISRINGEKLDHLYHTMKNLLEMNSKMSEFVDEIHVGLTDARNEIKQEKRSSALLTQD